MPEANSIPIPLDSVGSYLDHAPSATSKLKLLDRLHEALRYNLNRYAIKRDKDCMQ